MKLTQWMQQKRGRQTALAGHLGVTQSAVSQWRQNGVPVRHMPAIARFTRRAVTIEDMVRARAAA